MYKRNNNPQPTIAAIMILLAVFVSHAAAAVSVNASEYALPGKEFGVRIEIDEVEDLDSGQFDISFNSSVLNVTDITDGIGNGEIGGTEIPVENKYFMGEDTVRLLFNLPGVSGVSGSGTLATIVFEAVGNNSDTSFLDLSDGLLVDKESDVINADWIDGMVTIGDGALPLTELPLTEYTITVYVKNIDDDRLDIHLLIDGNDCGFESISSYRAENYGDYDLEEGVHRFTIRWFDTDTGELYEKTEEHNITGATTIMLRTDEHDEEGDGVSTHVYAKNLDDDRLDVYLYIDGFFKDYDRISSGYTREFGRQDGYKLTEGNHTFRIEWYDPDTEKEHQMIKECLITGDAVPVTIYIEKHDKISTHVYVMNLDDDDLDVYLYIDEFFKDFEDKVSPFYTREFGESDGYKLTEGNHTFRIEWYDPDTGEEHQTTRECLIERDAAVTLYTEEHGGGEGGISARAYVEHFGDVGDSSGSEFVQSTYLLSYWLPSMQSTLFK